MLKLVYELFISYNKYSIDMDRKTEKDVRCYLHVGIVHMKSQQLKLEFIEMI